MLHTRNLVFQYSQEKVFNFPDIHAGKGEQWLLSGNSGSGKTTLLHLIAGILKSDSGEVMVNGTDIQRKGFRHIDQFRGKNMGIIFQKHFFAGSLNMADNLLMAQKLPGLPVNKDRINGLMEELKVLHLQAKKPLELSQGELQRFSIARALVNQPVLLLADEPTSSLDDENCKRFTALIREVSVKHDTTLLIATHDSRLRREFENIIQL